jgi:hypothetical protein
MSNISIDVPLVSGGLMPFIDLGQTCKEAVELLTGDDFGAPPRCLRIIVHTRAGRTLEVTVPYDAKAVALVRVDGEEI